MASSNTNVYLLLLFVIFGFCLSRNGVYAFGAGNIPSFSYIEGKAFRHGDIEDVLADLLKQSGGFALANLISKGSKFSGLDIKRVYFGNWLRDYSQAVDIAGLKKLPLQTIVNLCMVLGFLAHGYATHEFEVTPERLACYLPVEHIDNPKGYGDGEDARRYHAGLRGPVNPRELEIDPRTGMKNYIANESGTWDTSKALVRRTLQQCIHLGRQHRGGGTKQDLYEAYRLLGTALHTLEDFPAHSNFCELALMSMGHTQVFTHVGDQVRVQAPNGRWVPPLVTGTFGSSDFMHSLLGEASDKLSSASVTDLSREIETARSKSMSQTRGPGGPRMSPADALRDMMFALPGGEGKEMSRELDNIERMRAGVTAGGKRPEDMSPQEMHSVLWQILTFRDSLVKKIEKTIEKIPGLGSLIEKLMDSISIFVLTTLEPFVKPLLKSATSGLQTISGEVIDNHDQYEVFNDPRASDPTHSFLSKDHFDLILNEPAGMIARVIVVNGVKLVQNAWDNVSVPVGQVTEEILQCLFHPDFHNSNSKVQREILQCLREWYNKHPKQNWALNRLSKNAVRNHENVRQAGEGGPSAAQGSLAESQAQQFQQKLGQQVPLFGTALNLVGNARDAPGLPESPAGGYAHPPGPPPSISTYAAHTGPPSISAYAPPAGPPPQSYHAPGHSGYAPSYGSPPSVSGPAYSGGTTPLAFPTTPGGFGAPSPGPPAFPMAPGGYASPPGPPPSFPGYGGQPEERSHQQNFPHPQQQHPQQCPQQHPQHQYPGQPYQPPYGGGW